MLTDLETREALHVLLLEKLAETTRPGSFALKGGVNLRLFFGSARYSEDMDLDLAPAAKHAVLSAISRTLKGEWLQRRLLGLGAEGIEYSGRPTKNTDTTVRIKLAVVNHGGIRLSTKIEMSLRTGTGGEAVEERAADPVVRKYLAPDGGGLVVMHHPRPAAIRQKLGALALRRAPQARDVFDLYVLAHGRLSAVEAHTLRGSLTTEQLEEARRRVWEFGYADFSDQVLEFLPPDDRRSVGSQEQWEARQLFVVDLISAVLNAGPA
jgi:hypothetical protein